MALQFDRSGEVRQPNHPVCVQHRVAHVTPDVAESWRVERFDAEFYSGAHPQDTLQELTPQRVVLWLTVEHDVEETDSDGSEHQWQQMTVEAWCHGDLRWEESADESRSYWSCGGLSGFRTGTRRDIDDYIRLVLEAHLVSELKIAK